MSPDSVFAPALMPPLATAATGTGRLKRSTSSVAQVCSYSALHARLRRPTVAELCGRGKESDLDFRDGNEISCDLLRTHTIS